MTGRTRLRCVDLINRLGMPATLQIERRSVSGRIKTDQGGFYLATNEKEKHYLNPGDKIKMTQPRFGTNSKDRVIDYVLVN